MIGDQITLAGEPVLGVAAVHVEGGQPGRGQVGEPVPVLRGGGEGGVAGGSCQNLAMSMFDLEFVMERDRFEYCLPSRRGGRDLLRKGMKKLP